MLKYRPVTEDDREKLVEWIAADADHCEKCDPDFWLKPEEGVRLFAVQDEQDDVFFVRAENVMRLHIQFCSVSERKRLAKAIDEFTPMIAEGARQQKYKQLIFESIFKPLIRFLSKRGFKPSPAENTYDLS